MNINLNVIHIFIHLKINLCKPEISFFSIKEHFSNAHVYRDFIVSVSISTVCVKRIFFFFHKFLFVFSFLLSFFVILVTLRLNRIFISVLTWKKKWGKNAEAKSKHQKFKKKKNIWSADSNLIENKKKKVEKTEVERMKKTSKRLSFFLLFLFSFFFSL